MCDRPGSKTRKRRAPGVAGLCFCALITALMGLAAGGAGAALPEESEAEAGTGAGPGPLTPVERPIEDELILQVWFGRYILSDGIIGYLHRGGVLLPLGEITRLIDFPIIVDPVEGQAEGWFLSENRRVFLDITDGEAWPAFGHIAAEAELRAMMR